MKNFILKLQNLPEHIKKIIVFAVTGVIAIILGIIFLVHSYNTINRFQKDQFLEQIKFDSLKGQVNSKLEESEKEKQNIGVQLNDLEKYLSTEDKNAFQELEKNNGEER